jgi:hypothetical protein
MNDIIIRVATMADVPTLLRFEQGLITAERPFDSTLKKMEHTRYYDLEHMIHADHIQLLVAELGGEPIGCGYARIEDANITCNIPTMLTLVLCMWCHPTGAKG